MKKKSVAVTLALTVIAGMCLAKTAHAKNAYCREYTQTFTISGITERGYGTACLQPDGAWKIVSQKSANNMGHNIQYIVKKKVVYIVPRTKAFAPNYHKPHRKNYRQNRYTKPYYRH